MTAAPQHSFGRSFTGAPTCSRTRKSLFWEFVERDIRYGMEGWQIVPLPPAASTDVSSDNVPTRTPAPTPGPRPANPKALALPNAPPSEPADPAAPPPIDVHLSWGHTASPARPFHVQLITHHLSLTNLHAVDLEPHDVLGAELCRSHAGAGDVDGLEFQLAFPQRTVTNISNLQQIWRYLLDHSDPDTARRLKSDPAYRPDDRLLTVQMDSAATSGFSLTVDQLLRRHAFWVPELDVFLTVGNHPPGLAEHLADLQPWRGQRTLDQVNREPEATYADFASRWADMGSPAYRNPHSVPPGHIVCLAWDSSLHKFGIDRGAGVHNDYGKADRFLLEFGFGRLNRDLEHTWKGQTLNDGLPIITTTVEKDRVRYEVEQFAYPLHGPPAQRRGNIPMVLLQKVRLHTLDGQSRVVPVELLFRRPWRSGAQPPVVRTNQPALVWEDPDTKAILLSIEGQGLELLTNRVAAGAWFTNDMTLGARLTPARDAEWIIKLPSPVIDPDDQATFLALDYSTAKQRTRQFWSQYLARGAQFDVPEKAVNTLFRASLWHALRLPRRHGVTAADGVDLPYSNFAYDQTGTPWPVNQAVYVDDMLYDLRGYHDLSEEELGIMFRNNQESNGHVGGFANWGVYTPAMICSVAEHYLLSGDRASFERLLPQTLRAFDWCEAEMKRAFRRTGPDRGLILAPLNDLSHDPRAWAFNQAYFFAAADRLARALSVIDHPRADDCRAAAAGMFEAIQRGFGHASMLSPLVQMRDHTWMPYVPADALTPGRLLAIWYPTDVDTGALHLSRLRALDPRGPLTTFLLNDMEDNLFLNHWGMANEPVYNQHAMAYLPRENPKAAIRSFYSMLACAFSHTVFESVEHRWGWGQYFCPPSTDGAWFDLYRHMLIQERDDGTLLLLQAPPRKWFEDGKRIRIRRAPTYYGNLNLEMESRTAAGEIRCVIETPSREFPKTLLLRLRHPQGAPLHSVRVNGRAWDDFDPANEWIRIVDPREQRYSVVANYTEPRP